MPIKCLAQGHNILMPGFEPSTSVAHKRNKKSISASMNLKLIELELRMSTFHLNYRHFSQKQFFAMVAKIECSVDCLLIGYLEEFFLLSMNYTTTPMLCKRYIDDVVNVSI